MMTAFTKPFAKYLALGLGLWALVGFAANAQVQTPPGDIPFGVYDPDGDFSAERDVTVEHLFLPWEDVYLPSLNDADAYALERNRALLVTVEPWTWSRSQRNTAKYLKNGIFSGAYDANMHAICEILGTLKSPVTLRFMHEMDDQSGQFIWSGWQPEEFIQAYRRMVGVCKEDAPNINLMWSPLGNKDMAKYYPGDEFADLVGLTVFGLQAWDKAKYGHDRTFDEVFGPRYERAAKFGKPVVVAELGYVGKAPYVDTWKNSVRAINPEYPSLVGVVYFNFPEVYPWPEGFGTPDWRIKNQVLD
jgi:endoglucanase